MEPRTFRAFFLDDSFHDKVQGLATGLPNQHEQDFGFTSGPGQGYIGHTEGLWHEGQPCGEVG